MQKTREFLDHRKVGKTTPNTLVPAHANQAKIGRFAILAAWYRPHLGPPAQKRKWGIAKGSSVSWVAKLKRYKNSERKLSNGWSGSYKVIKLLLSAGQWVVASYREISQHPNLPLNFITHGFLHPSTFPEEKKRYRFGLPKEWEQKTIIWKMARQPHFSHIPAILPPLFPDPGGKHRCPS